MPVVRGSRCSSTLGVPRSSVLLVAVSCVQLMPLLLFWVTADVQSAVGSPMVGLSRRSGLTYGLRVPGLCVELCGWSPVSPSFGSPHRMAVAQAEARAISRKRAVV